MWFLLYHNQNLKPKIVFEQISIISDFRSFAFSSPFIRFKFSPRFSTYGLANFISQSANLLNTIYFFKSTTE